MRWFVSLLLLLTGAVSAAAPQTQTFTDDLGRTVTVPLHPQRIVSMHDLDITIPLIELGAPPIASHGRTRPDGSHYLRASAQLTGVDFDNSDIRFIGTADIDLEAVAAARPDLIITEPSRHVSVEQLEKIAPTVSIDHLQGSAPEIYRKLAQLTGTQPRLAILERRYQEQIKQLKAMVIAVPLLCNRYPPSSPPPPCGVLCTANLTARLSPARHGQLRRTEGLKVVGSAS